MRRLFTDAARIIENEVGILVILHWTITLGQQRSGNFLRIMSVHLTAEGLNIKSLAFEEWLPSRRVVKQDFVGRSKQLKLTLTPVAPGGQDLNEFVLHKS